MNRKIITAAEDPSMSNLSTIKKYFLGSESTGDATWWRTDSRSKEKLARFDGAATCPSKTERFSGDRRERALSEVSDDPDIASVVY